MLKKFLVFVCFLGLVVGCGDDSSNPPSATNKQVSVVAVGGDFSNPLGLIYLKNEFDGTTNVAKNTAGTQITTYQDSIVKSYNSKIYVMGRDSNSAVLVLDNSGTNKDPIANYSLAKLDSSGTIDIDGGSNGTNPYDIVFKSESEAYVCFYNSNYLLKINPLTGKRIAKIDVSFMKTITGATASDATAPNIVDLELIDDKLYILAQRLNASFAPLESVMAIYNISTSDFIDTNTSTTSIDGIILKGKNPSEMIYLKSSNRIYVSQRGAITYAPDFSVIDSTEIDSTGIEEVDIATNKSNGIIIPGTAFGGTVGGFGISKLLYNKTKDKVFAAYDAFDFSSNIKEVNLTAKTVSSTPVLLINATAFGDSTIASDGYIYLINRSSVSPSIDVYNTDTNSLVKSIATELPMQSISVVNE
jgi:hypothetical protein